LIACEARNQSAASRFCCFDSRREHGRRLSHRSTGIASCLSLLVELDLALRRDASPDDGLEREDVELDRGRRCESGDVDTLRLLLSTDSSKLRRGILCICTTVGFASEVVQTVREIGVWKAGDGEGEHSTMFSSYLVKSPNIPGSMSSNGLGADAARRCEKDLLSDILQDCCC